MRSLDCVFTVRSIEPHSFGCIVGHGLQNVVTIRDDNGARVLSSVAPPFVTEGSHSAYASRARRYPGLTFEVEWTIDDWPGVGRHSWTQCFADGVECPRTGESASPSPEMRVACTYLDLVGFLMGDVPYEDMAGGARILKGGVGGMCCLEGLIFDDGSLRKAAMDRADRGLLVASMQQLVVVDDRPRGGAG